MTQEIEKREKIFENKMKLAVSAMIEKQVGNLRHLDPSGDVSTSSQSLEEQQKKGSKAESTHGNSMENKMARMELIMTKGTKKTRKEIEEKFPFLSVVTYGGQEFIGIVNNQDNLTTTMYVYSDVLTPEEKAKLIELGEIWWWESNRM